MHPFVVDSQRQSDRTWLIIVIGILVIALFGIAVWNQKAPADSIDEEAINNIESQLRAERFVLTNTTFMHSETIAYGIPISKILGTSKDSASRPLQRDGANLTIDYEFKGHHAFNIWMHADPAVSGRANQIAADLRKTNPKVTVIVLTNSLAAGASK